MAVTNRQSGTNVHEVADGIYRINTPVHIEGGPGGFSFNQYLVVDDAPLIFHTGPRKMFPLVREAAASVLPVERLRYICGFRKFWHQLFRKFWHHRLPPEALEHPVARGAWTAAPEPGEEDVGHAQAS
jgi:hypothetical protein